MAAGQRGEAAPYRRLLAELRPWLLRYFARRLPPASVEDAVQDTLIAIHTKRHTWDPDRPFGPWLAGIARYKWIDRLRAASRHAADELPETLSTPDHEAAVTSAAALAGLMATLKPAQAEVIRLVKLDGLVDRGRRGAHRPVGGAGQGQHPSRPRPPCPIDRKHPDAD